MSIMIELEPDLERRVVEEAQKIGILPAQYILKTLESHLENEASTGQVLDETILLEQIATGLSTAEWRHYHELQEKRRAESLTSIENRDLIALSNRIEMLNVRRMAALSALAQRRNSTLESVMRSLGIPETVYG